MEANYLDGKQLDMSNGTTTVNECSNNESKMEFLTEPQYSAISEHSLMKGTPEVIRGWLISLQQDFPVNRSQLPEKDLQKTTSGICGLRQGSAFALYDQDLHFWKTCQASFLQDISERYSESFPKSGMMQDGVCYLLQTSGLHTKERDCGYLPTPNAWNGRRGPGGNGYNPKSKKQSDRSLETFVKYYPTPTMRDWKDNGKSPAELNRNSTTLATIAGGQLNPNWVEWLMGWPVGWTDLKPLEMDRFQQWYERHGMSCASEPQSDPQWNADETIEQAFKLINI